MQPRQMGETSRPVRPSLMYSMIGSYARRHGTAGGKGLASSLALSRLSRLITKTTGFLVDLRLVTPVCALSIGLPPPVSIPKPGGGPVSLRLVLGARPPPLVRR